MPMTRTVSTRPSSCTLRVSPSTTRTTAAARPAMVEGGGGAALVEVVEVVDASPVVAGPLVVVDPPAAFVTAVIAGRPAGLGPFRSRPPANAPITSNTAMNAATAHSHARLDPRTPRPRSCCPLICPRNSPSLCGHAPNRCTSAHPRRGEGGAGYFADTTLYIPASKWPGRLQTTS